MSKFKVGDRVRNTAHGLQGVIEIVHHGASRLPYTVLYPNGKRLDTTGAGWVLVSAQSSDGQTPQGALVHPLHSTRFILDHVETTGRYPDKRATGRSTAQALHYIAKAIEHPFESIAIVDHHGTRLADEHLVMLAQYLANSMGLQHLYFDKQGRTVTFGRS